MMQSVRLAAACALSWAAVGYEAQAVTDAVWGEAWNSSSVVGAKNMTFDSNQFWNNHVTEGSRGSAYMLFNNDSSTTGDYLHMVLKAMPAWIRLTVADTCQEGKDLVLKKYRLENGSAKRAPTMWRIYGAYDTTVTPDDMDKLFLLSEKKVEGAMSAEVDISANAMPFRTYLICFDANGGDSLIQVTELYLFGEIKDHVDEILYTTSGPFAGLYDGYSHGLSVNPTYPNGAVAEYSADGVIWSPESPFYREVGEYVIYYRVKASGYETKTGQVAISILEPPRENLDIVATVKAADKSYFSAAQSSTSGGVPAGGVSAIFNQEVTTRVIVRGNPTIDVVISDAYRPGDEIVVTNFRFVANSALDSFTTQKLLKSITISGRNSEEEEWTEIYSASSHEWLASRDFNAATGLWAKSLIPERKVSYRQYRFSNWTGSDIQADEFCLLGTIGAKASGFDYTVRPGYTGHYDSYPHGAEVVLRSPANATVSYSTSPDGPWQATSPEIVRPGNLTVYCRFSAPGLDDVVEHVDISVLPAPRRNLDIFATVIAADKEAGYAGYFEASAGPHVDASGGTLTNIANAAKGSGKVTFNNSPHLVEFTISDAYRRGEYVLPERLTVGVATNLLSFSQRNDLPTNWVFSASTDGVEWKPLVEYHAEAWDAPENFSSDGGNTMWTKSFPITPDKGGWRHYRLVAPKRFALSLLKLYGSIDVPRGLTVIFK